MTHFRRNTVHAGTDTILNAVAVVVALIVLGLILLMP